MPIFETDIPEVAEGGQSKDSGGAVNRLRTLFFLISSTTKGVNNKEQIG